MTWELTAISIAAGAAILAFAVSRHVWADARRTRQERIAEVGLIWLVPVFGALLALAISAEDPRRVRRSQGFFPGA